MQTPEQHSSFTSQWPVAGVQQKPVTQVCWSQQSASVSQTLSDPVPEWLQHVPLTQPVVQHSLPLGSVQEAELPGFDLPQQ